MKFKYSILFIIVILIANVNSQNIAILTFSMPSKYDIYQDGDNTFGITVKNEGFVTVHNVTIIFSGIPEDSYSIQPNLVDILEKDQSTQFSISVDSKKINPDTYSLSVTIKSDETSEFVKMTLNVRETTREIGELMKKHEEVKPSLEATKNTLIGIIVLSGAILITTVIRFFFRSHYMKEKDKKDKELIEYEG